MSIVKKFFAWLFSDKANRPSTKPESAIAAPERRWKVYYEFVYEENIFIQGNCLHYGKDSPSPKELSDLKEKIITQFCYGQSGYGHKITKFGFTGVVENTGELILDIWGKSIK